MRSIVRPVLVAIVTALVALAVGPGTANAGGPTSVLIVNPSTGATASLYATDADYATLQEALEPSDITVDPMPSLTAGPGTSAINITWLIHDVSVWRVDHVRLDDRRLWVQTNTVDFDKGSEITWNNDWHLAEDEEAAFEVLDRLGVLNWKAGDAPGGETADEKPALGTTKDATGTGTEDDAAPLGLETAASSSARADALAGWWWLLPGLIIGVALAVVGRPYVLALAARREPGPRHQLIDL
jgi:hypothetical protein